MTREAIDSAASRIFLMKFFPSSDVDIRATIVEDLGGMCSTDEQVLWLGKQFSAAYNEWPGISELRAFFCAVYKPADGIEANSGVFFEGGIPARLLGKPPGLPALSEGNLKQLPAPRALITTTDAGMQGLVSEMAQSVEVLPRRRRTIQEIEAELYKKRDVPSPAVKIEPA